MNKDTQNFIDYLIANKIIQPYSSANMKRCGISERIISYIEEQYEQKAQQALEKWGNTGYQYDE